MSERKSTRTWQWLKVGPRRLLALLSTPAGIVLGVSLFALLFMYFSNSDWGGDRKAPRGDGRYRPVLARGDGHMMFLMTRSLVLDGDLVYDNDLRRFGDPWRQPRTKTGRKMIPHPIGPSLAQAPAFGLAHVTSKVANAFGAKIPSHGYTIWHQRIVFLFSVLAGFGAIWLGFLASRRWIGGRWAPLYAAVAVLFGTSLTYYATYQASYAHAFDAFFSAAFLGYWALTFDRWDYRRFLVLGVLLGAAALIRVTGFSLGIVVLVEVVARTLRRPDPPQSARARALHIVALVGWGALVLAVALLVFTPQLVVWKKVFGEWVTSPMGPRFVRLGEPEWVEVLFSSRNGWLSTHPIAYAGVVGLLFVPRRARLVAGALLAAVVLQVYVNSCVYDWWAGASFGQRRLCSVTFVLVVGLAALLRAGGLVAKRLPPWARHAVAIPVLGWFVAWNITQVRLLRRGKAANSRVRPMCCKGVPKPLSTLAQPIYDRVGNPFALPASLLLSWRYGVPVKRWDQIVGHYADYPDLRRYNAGRHWIRRRHWRFPQAFITGGLGPPQRQRRRGFRWTIRQRAGVLVPLFVANERRTFSLEVMANPGLEAGTATVELRLNGRRYVTRRLDAGWNRITFEVSPRGLRRGMNHLEIRATPRPYARPPGAPPLRLPPHPRRVAVGVALANLIVGYPPRRRIRRRR